MVRQFICFSISVLLLTANAVAQIEIDDPFYTMGGFVRGTGYNFQDDDFDLQAFGAFVISGDHTFPNGQVFGFGTITLEAIPRIAVRSEISGDGGDVLTRTGATFAYDFRINKDLQPPVNVISVPVRFDYLLTVDATNLDPEAVGYEAVSSVNISRLRPTGGPVQVFNDIVEVRSGSGSLIEQSPEGALPFEILTVSTQAVHEVFMSAVAEVGGLIPSDEPANHEISAFIDPVITFDQATFDEMMGDRTYPLADFFSIEFSPGILNVPEPTTTALALAAALCLAFRRYRQLPSA